MLIQRSFFSPPRQGCDLFIIRVDLISRERIKMQERGVEQSVNEQRSLESSQAWQRGRCLPL